MWTIDDVTKIQSLTGMRIVNDMNNDRKVSHFPGSREIAR